MILGITGKGNKSHPGFAVSKKYAKNVKNYIKSFGNPKKWLYLCIVETIKQAHRGGSRIKHKDYDTGLENNYPKRRTGKKD